VDARAPPPPKPSFPGFNNAFSSTLGRTNSREEMPPPMSTIRKGKGKGKMLVEEPEVEEVMEEEELEGLEEAEEDILHFDSTQKRSEMLSVLFNHTTFINFDCKSVLPSAL